MTDRFNDATRQMAAGPSRRCRSFMLRGLVHRRRVFGGIAITRGEDQASQVSDPGLSGRRPACLRPGGGDAVRGIKAASAIECGTRDAGAGEGQPPLELSETNRRLLPAMTGICR